jgi:DNA-binding CsgD family transcriptional regulator
LQVQDPINEALLERASELQRISRVLDAASSGEGSVIVCAGGAGMGKTKLLEAAIEDSAAVGARALVARASELEREFAFGVVRQLVEEAVLRADEGDRDELFAGAASHAAAVFDLDPEAGFDRDVHSTLHGLYWLLVNLATASPLLLAVDDIQWADEPSLRWLAYTARRLERLPIVLMVTARTDPESGRVELPDSASDTTRDAIEELIGRETALRLDPAPLSAGAVRELLAAQFDTDPDEAFAGACSEHTGGNPFLLSELAAELEAENIAPTAANVDALAQIVPERVGETIRRHLSRLGSQARALATSVAVLGDAGELPVAAELAGMEMAAAAEAAAELVAAQILADVPELRFRHPLLRAAVEAETPAVELAGRHGHAAQLLAERGAPAGRIATHLLASPSGGGQAWAVETLRDAARSARAQGVPPQAAALLRRALAEPPAPALRATVLRELGEAELSHLHDDAAEHFRQALELTSDPGERAELAEQLGFSLYHGSNHGEGVQVVLEGIEEARRAGLREPELRLEGLLALLGRYDLDTEEATRGRVHALAATLTGETVGERLVIAIAELEVPGPTAEDLYQATVKGERTTQERPWPGPAEGIGTVAMYLHAGRPDAAIEFAEDLIAKTREQGSPLSHALGVGARAMVEAEVGDVAAADADLAWALEVMHDLGEHAIASSSAGLRLATLAEMGKFDEAEGVIERYGLAGELPRLMFFNPTLYSRGALRLSQRRFEEAEADFRELGSRHAQWRIVRPTPAWRSGAAHALIGQGRSDEAAEFATEEVEIARVWNTPKSISVAVRALALTRPAEESVEGLTEAVEVLEDTNWKLERAKARCDLGSALRRTGRRRDGREQLSIAMDEAHACGAEPLAERAAEELRASGARPRRRAISGLDALTPSERRVAELAAAGRTNREIAQELFVTMATVETHLTRTYRKLEIEGRDGLSEALA